MKEDAPAPKHPPKKRYQIQNAQKVPELWLATWANDSDLPEHEREMAQQERDRRKALHPDRILGVLVDVEDVTPHQLAMLKTKINEIKPTAIHHPWTTRRVAGVCKGIANDMGIPRQAHAGMRDVVLNSMMVLAAPRAPEDFASRTPAWEAVHYARHRKLLVIVILPTGELV